MDAITQFVRALGPARLAAMGAVAAGLIGFFIFLMLRLSQPQMAVLFTDLPFEDSIEVVKRLEGLNVPHQVRQDGAIIMVPKDNVLKLRMKLAEDGLPAGGTVGYEVFDKSNNLGATSFVQNINHLRAIEGELSRTIRALNRVKQARVHLVIPQRKLFAKKTAEPSASIVLKVRGSLEPGQIKAIQYLTASAVEGLRPMRVSIVDERGKLLASGQSDDKNNLGASAIEERNQSFERRLQGEIEQIVASVVGQGGVRVRVNAELDYNKVTKTSDIYDPDGQVVRSTQTRSESSNSSQPSRNGAVTVGNELPAANADNNNGTQKENANKSEEVVNYEISRTTKTEIVEAGTVKKISVAVLVDGIYGKDADGKPTYTPRTQAQLDQITQLVRSAIGFDRTRGDQLFVTNLRFANTQAADLGESKESSMFDFTKDDYFFFAELFITLLIALLVLLFVVRPLVRRIITPEETEEEKDESEEVAGQVLIGEDGQPVAASAGALVAPDGTPLEATENAEMAAVASKTKDLLDSAKLNGDVHASAIREVGEIVGGNTDEAVGVIRDWIHSDAA